MDCRVCTADADLLFRLIGEGKFVGKIGSFSLESEHDLAVMVSDFMENGSSGPDSRCSSDSESALADLNHLADKISLYQYKKDHHESKLTSIVHSLILSLNKAELHFIKSSPCNASCIRFSLVKLLRLSGYDAAVCLSKWQSHGKIPGGNTVNEKGLGAKQDIDEEKEKHNNTQRKLNNMWLLILRHAVVQMENFQPARSSRCTNTIFQGDHEYIDVVIHRDTGVSERLVIDIDFRSHFEIARAVESYDRILNSLPVVYVGSLPKLKQYLQVMVEAARCSLKENSMPLPPWRSLAYLQAKWHSQYERKMNPDGEGIHHSNSSTDHRQCIGHLRRFKSSLQSEIEAERLLKPINSDNNRRIVHERRRRPTIRAL
ncbi:hypothetical protein C5167_002952 [Papaver somniferum]|uniref:DUF506 domain-containing protein n=1 Tax=Papaver somniferum TaxID=3469 RepID=A0A4Y7L1B4_PAPSO|nr:hypothetical protein C5167_002952 [Papaver somniferum]